MSRPTEQSRFGALDADELAARARVPQVGWTREDEDGWFIVDRRDLDDDVDGFWVSDRWGAEKFIPASRMGDNWKAPL